MSFGPFQANGSFNRQHTALHLEHYWKTKGIPTVCSQEATFKFWSFCTIFPPLQSEIWYRHTLISSLPFARYTKIANKTHTHLYFHRHYTTVTCATVLFHEENHQAGLLSLHEWYKFVLAAVVSSHSQSRNYLFAPHIEWQNK